MSQVSGQAGQSLALARIKTCVSKDRISRGRTGRICILEGKEAGPHKIQGIGTGFVPKTLDTSVYNKVLSVTGDEAMETAREVGRKEGILVGISSGAAIAAALKVAKELGKGKKVLAVVPDNGERYLSTALYQEM